MAARYLADHIGSLLRPTELLQFRGSERVDRDRLRALEDKHILGILQRQKDLGFKIFTDGELRRLNFMSDFNEAVEGLDDSDNLLRSWQAGGAGSSQPSRVPGIVTGKVKQARRLTEHEVAFMKQHSPGDIKITLPTANQFPAIYYKKGISDKVYANYSDFLWDTDQALDEAIRVDNACLDGAKRGSAILAIHLCRGNNRSQWYAEGGYDAIAERLFGQLQVDAFLLEYESERAGTFEPLRFVPCDKTVVLGLVSSKLPQLEQQDQLTRRITEASKYVPLENLAISPQCGFASTMEGNLLTEDEQWRKLKLVVDTAKEVWGHA